MKTMLIREDLETVSEEDQRRLHEAKGTLKEGLLPSKIVTVVEAIHNGMTKNFTYYPADKLEQSAPTWTDPYRKPVLKNHDTYTEPLGRVIKQEFVKSSIDPNLFTIRLHLEITDPDTIAKVLDGRYHTLSIGGSTDSCICSICNKDIVKEGFCGHWKGRTYEGKQAFWTIGNMTFDEISFVNVPADANAQVIIPNALDSRTNKRKESVSTEGGAGMSKPIEESVLDVIDNLASVQEGVGETPAAGVTQEGNNTPSAAQTTESTNTAPTVESLQEQVTNLTAQLEEANRNVASVTAERDQLQARVAELETRVSELEAENAASVRQNAELAVFVRKVLAEHSVNLQIMLGRAKAEDREALVAEHAKLSAKTLSAQIAEMRDQSPARVIERVTSPGLAQHNDPHAQTEGELTESTNGSGKVEEKKLDDLVNAALKALNRSI
jgi:regulator of replication initiation timing